MANTQTMGVKLDDDTRARLKALGNVRDRSPHYLMRKAIEEFLDREEAREEERQIVLARWEEYQRTGDAVDGDVVDTWLRKLAHGQVEPCPDGD